MTKLHSWLPNFLNWNQNELEVQKIERPTLSEFLDDEEDQEKRSFTGTITSLVKGEGVIDNDIYFTVNSSTPQVKIGDKVKGQAARSSKQLHWRATQIYLCHEDWDGDFKETCNSDQFENCEQIPHTFIGKVQSIYDNHVCLSNRISFYINEDNCDFDIFTGDWVECERDEDEENGLNSSIAVLKVSPVRRKTIYGHVTFIQPNYFIINGEIFCHRSSVRLRIRVRDRVVATVIESDQRECPWRATNVWLDQATKIDPSKDFLDFPQILDKLKSCPPKTPSSGGTEPGLDLELSVNVDLEGLSVSPEFNVNFKDIGFMQYIKVPIKNASHLMYSLKRSFIETSSGRPQTSLDESLQFPILILPRNQIFLVFCCLAKTLGNNQETIHFDFGSGRFLSTKVLIHVECNPKVYRPTPPMNPCHKGRIVQGEKPYHASPFIPVKLPTAHVPDFLWDAVLGGQDILSACPVLLETLSKMNYVERFTVLLHLEEIQMNIQMRKYDIALTPFSPHGPYLSLVVEGLSENRPSLMVGDSVVASVPYQDAANGLRYEGIVHEVLFNKVLLKFNPEFHSNYHGEDYAVTLHFNRTPLRRCHMAVNNAMKQLGTTLLFPTKLNFQLPQVAFLEISEHMDTSISKPLDGSNCKHLDKSTTKPLDKSTSKPLDKLTGKTLDKSNVNPSRIPSNKSSARSGRDWFSVKKKPPEDEVKRVSFSLGAPAYPGGYLVPVLRLNKDLKGVAPGPGCRRDVPRLEWINAKLNKEQRMAVKMIVEGVSRPLPYIIYGPPGTGKTVTLVEALLQIYRLVPHSRILAVSPTNSACDLIALRAIQGGQLKTGQIIRINSFNRSKESIPEELIRYSIVASDLQDILHHRILVCTAITSGSLYATKLTNGHFTHLFIDEAGQLTEPETCLPLGLVNRCSGQIVLAGDPKQLGPVVVSPSAKRFGLYQSLLHRLCSSVLYQPENHDLKAIYSEDSHSQDSGVSRIGEDRTPKKENGFPNNTSGTPKDIGDNIRKNEESDTPKDWEDTHKIMERNISKVCEDDNPNDEEINVTKSWEDYTFKKGKNTIPKQNGGHFPSSQGSHIISRPRNKESSLDNQSTPLPDDVVNLPPKSRTGSSEGRLGTSQSVSFEPRLVTLLVRNYRSHPVLLKVPSTLFYHSSLKCAADKQVINRLIEWDELPTKGVPLVFHPIRGQNQQEGDSPSWFNPAEAFQVCRYVVSLLNFGLNHEDIGVITPYRKQVEKIRQLLSALGVEPGIKVGSVEDFQGQEKLAVVVSTVRSAEEHVQNDVQHNLGFLRCAQRFNVAVTRARALLVVVGNADLLSEDPNWRIFVRFCFASNAVKMAVVS